MLRAVGRRKDRGTVASAKPRRVVAQTIEAPPPFQALKAARFEFADGAGGADLQKPPHGLATSAALARCETLIPAWLQELAREVARLRAPSMDAPIKSVTFGKGLASSPLCNLVGAAAPGAIFTNADASFESSIAAPSPPIARPEDDRATSGARGEGDAGGGPEDTSSTGGGVVSAVRRKARREDLLLDAADALSADFDALAGETPISEAAQTAKNADKLCEDFRLACSTRCP